MKKYIAVAALLPLLAACGSDQSQYRAVCTDRITGNMLPDYACDHSGGNWYFMPMSTYHNQVEVHHYHHFTGGSYAAPRNVSSKVRYGNTKRVDVFTKPAGSSIKMNQDAKKSTTVRERPASTGRISRSSFKSSSNSYKPSTRR